MAAPLELPFIIHPGMDEEARIRAIQRNFEHLAGMATAINRGFATLGVQVAQFGGGVSEVVDEVTEYVADGNPPSSSPTPTVEGGPGYLAVSWDAVTNGSPVTYEVHMSTSSGFTPDASSLAGETSGTRLFLRLDPTGEPLVYDTTYYIQLVAKDVDGSADPGTEGSGEMMQVNSADIAVNAIQAGHILAGSITAEQLAAQLVLASRITTAETGQRVDISPDGIVLYDPLGDTIASLPTADNPYFKATIEALGLDVLGKLTLRGQDNIIEQGAVITLRDKTANPAAAPTISKQWDHVALADGKFRAGLWYDPSGTGGVPTWWTSYINLPGDGKYYIEEIRVSDGVVLRSSQMPNNGTTRVSGVVRLGTSIFVLLRRLNADGEDAWTIRKLAQSDLSFIDDEPVTGQVLDGEPCLTTDGTDVILASVNNSNGDIIGQRYNTSLVLGSTFTMGVDTLSFGSPSTNQLLGAQKVTEGGTEYWFVGVRAGQSGTQFNVRAYTTAAGVRTTSREFEGAAGAGFLGFAHDGTNWHTLSGNNPWLVQHSNYIPADANLYVRYAYEAGANTTERSPVAIAATTPRTNMRATAPALPSGMDSVVFYAGEHASAEPTLYEQVDSAATSVTLPETIITSGDTAPTGANVASATPAQFQSEDGSPILTARGYIRFKVTQTANQSVGTGSLVTADMSGATVRETESGSVVTASDYVQIPVAGEWLIFGSARWAGGSAGRHASIELNTLASGYSGFTNVLHDEGLIANSEASTGFNTTTSFHATVDLEEGDRIRVHLEHSVGSAIDCTDWNLQGVYLGPSIT